MEDEDRKKISFSIPSRSRPTAHSSAFSAVAEGAAAAAAAAPAPQFVTEFHPSHTLNPATPAAPVIAPLPNSVRILATAAVNGTTFVLDSSTDPGDSSAGTPYGLTVRAAAAPSEKAAPPHAAAATSDLTLRRYKEDMAVLPDHRGMDEFRDVPVEGFGAALLAGYGWSEGKGIGRNNANGGDSRVVEYNRRVGSHGLGYNPSQP